MTRVGILTSSITTGDAVSNDVFGMHSVLDRHGYEVQIFSGVWDIEQPRIRSVNEISDFLKNPNDVLLYHHSIGWDPALDLLGGIECRTVIKYHNVTPPELFVGFSKWHEERCHQGRQQLEAIAQANCDQYLSDSEYNRTELLAAGADPSKSFVVPPFHQIDRLQSVDADMETLDVYRDGKTVLLSVSRIGPHKGHPDLIEAFATYHHEYNQNSRLLIVGREEKAFEVYSTRLRNMLKFLCLEEAVVFAGEISDAALKACYLLGNVFICASKHEGFSVPLVEAMAMKVPVVAYSAAAIPETVGHAGILLDERNPYSVSEAVDLLVRDESANAALGLAGWRRYEQRFTNERTEELLLRALDNLN